MTSHRKLAAILSADVAGYSKLMADDERATVETLNAYREIIRKHVEAHDGRVVDSPGDALLAEFPSAVEGVQCAVEIQQELGRRNTQLAEHRRMQFRMGINLGDVIEEDRVLYGDGVNVAARLEALAEPGSVCISGSAFDQVDGKVPFGFGSIGEQQMKNMAKPVRAYRLEGGPGPTAHGSTLAMPTGPAIAVLPFTNMSGDPREDYFSDGLTEDIITELARFRDLHVLARNTTFQFKGQAVDVAAVGRKLGVRYMLEGSVRRAGSRARITAQLIDVGSGAHVWSERYDREMSDIFAVQDEITGKVIGAIVGIGGALQRAERRVAESKSGERVEAYDLVLRAMGTVGTSVGYQTSKAMLEQAIELDPRYARARYEYAWLMLRGWAHRLDGEKEPPDPILENAIRSVELDPADAFAHRTAAWGYFLDHQLDLFEREAQLALELAPFSAEIFAQLGMLFTIAGQRERGAALAKKGYALNADSAAGFYHTAMFYDLYFKDDYRRALEVIRQHPRQQLLETLFKYILAYMQLGEPAKAQDYWAKCVALVPVFSAEWMRENLFERWNFPEADTERCIQVLVKAGPPSRLSA
jgi:TolB-like protein/class 3 adenylate cyclase/tetratricopeptide (TPR) repeat protein